RGLVDAGNGRRDSGRGIQQPVPVDRARFDAIDGSRGLNDAVDDVTRVELGVCRPNECDDARDDWGRAARALPGDVRATLVHTDEFLARSRDADRDALA